MVIGFAMIKASYEHENEAYLDLRKVSGIRETYRILGEYQIFVILQAEDAIALHSLIDRIKNTPDVTDVRNVLTTDKEASRQLALIEEASLDFKVHARPCSSISAAFGSALFT